MRAEEFYALLLKKIEQLDAATIGAAVTAYLTEHPEYFLDLLGLYKDADGYICQQ